MCIREAGELTSLTYPKGTSGVEKEAGDIGEC